MNLRAMPLLQKKQLYIKAKKAYYELDKPIMSDAKFDRLEELIRAEDPDWKGFSTGAQVSVGQKKAKLPIPIYSLDKIKKPEQVASWLEHQDDVIVMDKVDGASVELVYKDGRPKQLFTRGNGSVGADISGLIPHLRIPQKVGTKDFIVRCEGVFTRSTFERYKKEFDAPRNAASSMLKKRKDVHTGTKDLTIIALQLLDPNLKMGKGLQFLKRAGFKVVAYRAVPAARLNFNLLVELLKKRKANAPYDCDGLVIARDAINRLPKAGNPDWAVAFKETVEVEDAPTTKVVKIHWKVSPHGYIIPRAEVEPVRMPDGATVRFAAAKNAKDMLAKGIGPGAIVRLVKAGDIIPDIVAVEKKGRASLPSTDEKGAYHWDKTKTNIVLDDPKASTEFRVQKIARTFDRLGVDFIRGKTIQRLADAGLDSVTKIIRATPADFRKVPGVKDTSAQKFYSAIREKVDAGFPLVQIMDASGMFPRGVGTTQLGAIAAKFNLMQLAKEPPKVIARQVMTLPGFQQTNADKIATGLPKFIKWLRITGIKVVKPKAVKKASSKLEGVNVSWTGYRDKEQEQTVVENGGSVISWSARRTTVLLHRPGGKASGKLDAARKAGIPTMAWEQFAKKYKL